MFTQGLRRGLRRRASSGSRSTCPTGRPSPGTTHSTYVKHPPYFDDMPKTPPPVERHHGRARARGARRQRDDRSHLARRLDQEGQPAGKYLIEQRRRPEGLQLVRLAPRQPRGHGARHVRQRAPPNQLAPGHRRRRHAAPARRRRRCRSSTRPRSTKPRRCPARRPRRQRVRLGLVARLGGQGDAPARRARGHRRELRAHPPLQPGRHGHPAARVPRRRERRLARAHGRGALTTSTACPRCSPSSFARGRDLDRPRHAADGNAREFRRRVRIDTPQEVLYYQHGGILQFVLRQLLG